MKKDQEAAFPVPHQNSDGSIQHDVNLGMSKRFYAAIKLRIPDSGEEWLDEMIRKANRRDAACAAMQGILTGVGRIGNLPEAKQRNAAILIADAYVLADELLKQEDQ